MRSPQNRLGHAAGPGSRCPSPCGWLLEHSGRDVHPRVTRERQAAHGVGDAPLLRRARRHGAHRHADGTTLLNRGADPDRAGLGHAAVLEVGAVVEDCGVARLSDVGRRAAIAHADGLAVGADGGFARGAAAARWLGVGFAVLRQTPASWWRWQRARLCPDLALFWLSALGTLALGTLALGAPLRTLALRTPARLTATFCTLGACLLRTLRTLGSRLSRALRTLPFLS